MDIKEICAEKIRAMSDRARYRDFYDIYLLLEKYKLNLKKVLDIVKQKEIRQPITKTGIVVNWKVVKTQKEKEMSQVYYARSIKDTVIEKMIRELPFSKIE